MRSKGIWLLACSICILSAWTVLADDWPQWLGPKRDGVWRETGIISNFPAGGPTIRWRQPIGGGYAGPAVANHRVYLMDRQLKPGVRNPADPFARSTISGTERILCLDEKDGHVLWTHEYDCPYSVSYPAGPRATASIDGGKVYALGAEGNLFCLEGESGKVIWSHDFKKEFGAKTPLWGFASHPLIDGGKLICIVGGEGSVAVAFNKETGQELWRALSAKEPGYAPPVIFEAGGKRQLIVWHPEAVNSLDPETGQVHWKFPWEARSGLAISTPRKSGDELFLTSFYNGSLMLRFDPNAPQVTEVWRSKKVSERDTDGLHSIISTPFFENGHIYGVCSYGQLRCLNAATGERLWETFRATTDGNEARWANAFVVKNGGRFFLFNEKGDLIIAELSPTGYRELGRAHLVDAVNTAPGRPVVWSHPAFANRSIYVRNDREIVCASLAE